MATSITVRGVGATCQAAHPHLTCQLPPLFASALRDSAGKDLGETISQDDAGHGDGDSQVRLARRRRHVRPAPHVRLCQKHRVRDASQVRQVAKWARPHSPALMRANAEVHPRHIFHVSLVSLVPSHRFARCARPPPGTRARAAAARVVHPTLLFTYYSHHSSHRTLFFTYYSYHL